MLYDLLVSFLLLVFYFSIGTQDLKYDLYILSSSTENRKYDKLKGTKYNMLKQMKH